MPDSDLTSALDQTRECNDRVIAISDMGPAAVRHLAHVEVPHLLAALEAVLELADSAEPVAQEWIPGQGHRFYTWTLDPAKVREAISRELAGKEENDG